jgi:hypothetical protein
MAITLKPGTRLFGASCDTQVIVVKAPADALDVRIGGHPAILDAASKPAGLETVAGHDAGTQMGKRYVDQAGAVELLCTKAGAGSIALGDEILDIKDAKPLPSSD